MKTLFDQNKKLLIKAGLSAAALLVARELYYSYQKKQAESNLDNNPATAQASALNTAFNPSGFSWLRPFDGTSVPAIMALAPQITDLDEVSKQYNALTSGRTLHDDLESELGPDDLQKFYSLASKGKTGSWYYAKESTTNVPANYWVFTIADANVRRTPKREAKLVGNNIVKMVGKGKILGATTGKFGYDEPNKTMFIEFWTLLTKENKRVTYFVAKSQIELVSNADKLARDKKQGVTPLELIEGINGKDMGGVEQNYEVFTIAVSPIYNEKFKKIGIVPRNTIIGFPLMSLDTGKGKYLQVKTVQGFIRWVKADHAKIRHRHF